MEGSGGEGAPRKAGGVGYTAALGAADGDVGSERRVNAGQTPPDFDECRATRATQQSTTELSHDKLAADAPARLTGDSRRRWTGPLAAASK